MNMESGWNLKLLTTTAFYFMETTREPYHLEKFSVLQ
jgi:hypothetical protein